MSVFVCNNKNCERYGKEDEYLSNRYTLVGGRLVSVNAPCPVCGMERKEFCEAENIPITEKNISIAKFASVTKEQKREMLKKRSHEHFEKHIKEEKEYKLHEAINNFKSIK